MAYDCHLKDNAYVSLKSVYNSYECQQLKNEFKFKYSSMLDNNTKSNKFT